MFLLLSRILGWILLVLHHAFLPKSSHKGKIGSYGVWLQETCKKTGRIFQLSIFTLIYIRKLKIIVSNNTSSTGVSLPLR